MVGCDSPAILVPLSEVAVASYSEQEQEQEYGADGCVGQLCEGGGGWGGFVWL